MFSLQPLSQRRHKMGRYYYCLSSVYALKAKAVKPLARCALFV